MTWETHDNDGADKRAPIFPDFTALNSSNGRAFYDEVKKRLDENRNLVLCLDRLESIDSTGIGILLSLKREAIKNGGAIKYVTKNEHIRNTIKLLNVDRLLTIGTSVDDDI